MGIVRAFDESVTWSGILKEQGRYPALVHRPLKSQVLLVPDQRWDFKQVPKGRSSGPSQPPAAARTSYTFAYLHYINVRHIHSSHT